MKICAAIPARLRSRRVPEKLLIEIGGKTVIQHTVDRVLESSLVLTEVFIITDSARIRPAGAINVLRRKSYENGTARICDNLDRIPAEYSHILIILGDQPLLNPDHIDKVIFYSSDCSSAINTVVAPCFDPFNMSIAKVVLNCRNGITHISRQPIGVYQHISLVLIPRGILGRYNSMKPTAIQDMENNEWIRFLFNCVPMRAHIVAEVERDLNTPEDLQYIQGAISAQRLNP